MRLSKYEKNMLRAQKRQAALEGTGLFIFRNNTSGELYLPRPTKSGLRKVPLGEEFQGDDYYMFMVRNNELRLVRQLEPTDLQKQQAQQAQLVTEQTKQEHNTMQDKLIVEQPPTVTTEGTEEVTVTETPEKKKKKLNEAQPAGDKSGDVLLNENPLDGVEII